MILNSRKHKTLQADKLRAQLKVALDLNKNKQNIDPLKDQILSHSQLT